MSERKKKTWLIKCEVNYNASHFETVVVMATKPHIAIQKAEAELNNSGFFGARAYSCEELK